MVTIKNSRFLDNNPIKNQIPHLYNHWPGRVWTQSGLLGSTCSVPVNNVAAQLPGDTRLQGCAQQAPVISVISTKMLPTFWSAKHKGLQCRQAVSETLSLRHQLSSHCVACRMCVSSLVFRRTPTLLPWRRTRQRLFFFSNAVFQSRREHRGQILGIRPEEIHPGASPVSPRQKREFVS